MLLTAALTAILLSGSPAAAPEVPQFTRKQDVVYGRKYGTALTMDVFEPTGQANGATVVWVVSGGWYSSHDAINLQAPHCPVNQLISRGYRVCAVVHGSNPLFTVEDAISDITRAVRFIRHTASENGKTTMPVGIIGGSAGGHLSLMTGTAGDDGKPLSADPVERASSRVQAVACYFPPTDFLNYGETNVNGLDTTVGQILIAPFQFKRPNPETKTLDLVTSRGLINKILGDISPINHVTPDDAPTMIIHGDRDQLVPIQQAEIFVDKMRNNGVETKLVTRPGAGHGWASLHKDNELLIDWFDKHLLSKEVN